MRHTRILAGCAIAIGALALATVPSRAGDQISNAAEVDPKPVFTDSVGESPAPVDSLIGAVGAWLDANPRLSNDWSGMTRTSDETLTVYWAGEIPEAFRTFLGDGHFDGIAVRIARYSAAELDAAIRELAAKHPEVGQWSMSPQFDGINAAVPSSVRRPDFKDYPIPVSVRVLDGESIPLSGRGDDTYPFYGGGQIFQSGTGDMCSTGFDVEFSGGAERMVTARHCGTNSDFRSPEGVYTSFPSTRRYVGSSAGGNASTDSMLLAPASSSGYFYRIFTGDWQSSTSRLVVGSYPVALYDVICAEGSLSGQQCANTITATGVYQTVNGNLVGPGFVADNDAGNAQAGHGDSGGPGVKLVSGGTSLKVAGMISAAAYGTWSATCPGYQASGRTCYVGIFYVNLSAILNAHNVSLVTAP